MAAATIEVPAFGVPVRFQRSELGRNADLSEGGNAILARARGPEALVSELHSSGETRDLVAVLAFLLPKRQAVWWACLSAKLLDVPEGSPQAAALNAAESWVQTGADDARERAHDAAEACDFDGPAAWAAMAAFWSGGSIAPRGQATVPPAAHLTGAAVRSALLLLAGNPGTAAGMDDLIAIGLEILGGGTGREAFDRVSASGGRGKRGA